MFRFLKINCDEATTICDKNQYGEATFLDKLRLSIHFVTCKICSLYTKQNNKLSSLYKGYSDHCKLRKCLDDKDKQLLKDKLKNLET